MNRPWRLTFWTLVAVLALMALVWLFAPMARALAAPAPQEAPRRLSDVGCTPMPAMVRVGPQGLEVSIVDDQGCIIGWIRWEPMVRSR